MLKVKLCGLDIVMIKLVCLEDLSGQRLKVFGVLGGTEGFQRKNWEGVKGFIFVVKCGVAH